MLPTVCMVVGTLATLSEIGTANYPRYDFRTL